MTVPVTIRLARSFDVGRLQRDLETALGRFRMVPQAGPYHDGSWQGIALRSPVTRVHLVIDCGVDESLLALFSEDVIEEIRASREIRINPPAIPIADDELERRAGFVRLPPGLFPFQPIPLLARIQPSGGRLSLRIFGAPDVIDFAPVAPDRFQHLSHELVYEESEGRPAWVRLRIPQIYTTVHEREFSLREVRLRLREKLSVPGRVGAAVQSVGVAIVLKLARLLTGAQQLWNARVGFRRD